MRSARLVCLGAAVLCVFLGLQPSGSPARADSATVTPPPAQLLTSFAAIAHAAGVFQTVDRSTGLEVTYQTVYGRLPDGYAKYSPQSILGRASVYYPGAAVVGVGSLLCAAGAPVCTLPPYPLTAEASANTPDAAVNTPLPTGGAGAPVGLGAGNADAHADAATGVRTNAVVNSYDTPQGTGSVVHVGAVRAHTSEAVTLDPKTQLPVLAAHAEASIGGVDILQGLIHIDNVFTTSTATDNGSGKRTRADDFQVSGVTANGMPATIGAHGVTVNGSSNGNRDAAAANQTLQGALSGLGFTVHTIGHSTNALLDKQCTAGEVDGIEIRGVEKVTIPPNLPGSAENALGQFSDTYFMDVVIGGACTVAFASAASASAPPPAGGPAPPNASSFTPPSASTPVTPFAEGVTNPVTPVGAPEALQTSGPATTPGRHTGLPKSIAAREPTLGRDASHSVRWLYIAFCLVFVGLLLGLLPFTPARLPSGR
ncbi:MAG: hypothetical protein ACYDH6_07855 [Acidimicrobiales bacterium]